MCRRCGHKSSTHHYRPGPTSCTLSFLSTCVWVFVRGVRAIWLVDLSVAADELLDLNKTLSDNNVARNAALLLKKTAFRVTSSDEIMTVG